MENNSKTIIFFIHGFCGSKLNNKILEDNFIKDGYVTVSFDLPGHGDDYENFINKGKKDWIKKVEDEFEKIKDFNNIVIIGFSMGADLALMLYDKIENKIKEKIKNAHYHKFGAVAPDGFLLIRVETLEILKDFEVWKEWKHNPKILEQHAIDDLKKQE